MRPNPSRKAAESSGSPVTNQNGGGPVPSQESSAHPMGLTTALGGLPQRQPAPPPSPPAADDASADTGDDVDHAPVAGMDFFSEMPDEIVTHVVGFAEPEDAARLSLANHRLHETLRAQRLSVLYVSLSNPVSSVEHFDDLLGKITALPRDLRREPLTALLFASARQPNHLRVHAFERILKAGQALRPSEEATLLGPLAVCLDYLAHYGIVKASDAILTRLACVLPQACPEWWGHFLSQRPTWCKYPSENALLVIGSHLCRLRFNANENESTSEQFEKLSQIASQCPARQPGLRMGLIAAIQQSDAALSAQEHAIHLDQALEEFKRLPPGQHAIALFVLSDALTTTEDPCELALEKLFPAIIELEPVHRSLPLSRIADSMVRHHLSAEALPVQQLRVVTLLCEQVTQLPLDDQMPVWTNIFELLHKAPAGERGEGIRQLFAAVNESDERYRTLLLEKASSAFGLNDQGAHHANQPQPPGH